MLIGCAGIDISPIDKTSDDRDGIVYHPQRPYLVVKKEFIAEGEEGSLFGTVENGLVQVSLGDLLGDRLGNKTLKIPVQAAVKGSGKPGAGELVSDDGPGPGIEETTDSDTETDEDSDQKIYTKAQGTLSWDPSVPRQEDVSDLFKILYLPDLDETRVIRPKAGIGQANLGVALGPGDTLNRFQLDIDNTALGEFLIDTARDFVTIAKEIAQKSALGALVSDAEAEALEGRAVELHYRYVGYATPGVYPILKSEEYKDISVRGVPLDPLLIPAEYPYTRVAFKVRRVLQFELKSLQPKPSKINNREGPVESPQNLETLAETLNAALTNQSFEIEYAEGESIAMRFASAVVTKTESGPDLKSAIEVAFEPTEEAVDTFNGLSSVQKEKLKRSTRNKVVSSDIATLEVTLTDEQRVQLQTLAGEGQFLIKLMTAQ